MKKAVLIMAYGGPDSLADIEPYLLDIRGGRTTSPELISEIRERYRKIGGRSPLLEITCAQAQALEKHLSRSGQYHVFPGMRHWKPYIRDSVAQIAAQGITSGIALCMAPHASRMSTSIYQHKLQEALESLPAPLEMDFIESWHDRPFLIKALALKVRETSRQFSQESQAEVHYLFTAHSLPAILKREGDPYVEQLSATARLLADELGLSHDQWTFGYQSAGAAPGEWLGPSVEELLANFSSQGIKNVLVTPVGFMADNVEILYDLDIEAQEIARDCSIKLVRSQTLNTSPDFISGLAEMILQRDQSEAANGQDRNK